MARPIGSRSLEISLPITARFAALPCQLGEWANGFAGRTNGALRFRLMTPE
jgi:hypothetical protein